MKVHVPRHSQDMAYLFLQLVPVGVQVAEGHREEVVEVPPQEVAELEEQHRMVAVDKQV